MKLKNIDEIKEDGLTVFMPSGIQATLFNEGENILVKYYNLREDRYSVEDFKELITEGIFIFNDLATGKQIIESKEDDFTETYEFKIEKLNDKGDFRVISGNEYVSDIYVPEGDTLKNNIQDYIDCEFMYDLDDSDEIVSTEIVDYNYDEELGEGSFKAIIFWNDYSNMDESVLTTLIKKGYIRESLAESFSEDLEEIEDAKEDTKIEIEIKDDKVEIEGEINGKEFEVEQPLAEPQEEPAETEEEKPKLSSFEAELADIQDDLIETDENGENTLESFFGLKEIDFGSKELLIKHIQEKTDYDVVSSDNLSLNVKDRTNPNAEEVTITLKHEMKEEKDKYNNIEDKMEDRIAEGYNQKDCKPGAVFTAMKNKKKEYLTNDFKIELLGILDRLSKEFPDIAVRKQAREWMDELGLQEYYNTDKIVAFARKYIKILDRHVVESFNEEDKWKYLDKFLKMLPKGITKYIGVELKDKDGNIKMGRIAISYKEHKRDNSTIFFNFNIPNVKDICQDNAYYDLIQGRIKETIEQYAKKHGYEVIRTTCYSNVSPIDENYEEEKELKSDKTGFINSVVIDKQEDKTIAYLINKEFDACVAKIIFKNGQSKFDYSALTGGREELKAKYNELDKDAIQKEVEKFIKPFDESLNEEDDKFNYMMLDRLRQDCEYFLSFGNRNEKRLWAGNVQDQIAEMRKIYDKLPEKPEWISLKDIDNYERQMLSKDESLNEGMWASPFTVENAEEVAKLLSEPITFAELNSEEGKQRLWNVIGDDNFWDGVEDMAIDFPENDAREWIADMLKAWMIDKDTFKDDAYSLEAEQIIRYAIRDNLNEDFENKGFEKDEAGIEHLLKDGYMHSITKTTPDKYRYNKTKWNNGSEETVEDKKDLSKEEVEEIIDKELNEEEHNYIMCKGQKINLSDCDYEWLDNDTFYFSCPESKRLIDEDGTYFIIKCEWHKDEQKFIFEAAFSSEENEMFDDIINLDKQNSYLTMNDKELIMAYMKKLMGEPVNESLNEGILPYERIAKDLQDGKKDGFEPTEYGNWKCTCSLDDKWETFTESMKAYILNEIGYQVNVGDLEFEDLEISIDYDDCLNADMDSNDIESLNMFDDIEILDMINNEFKPLTFLISYNIEFDNKIEEDCKVKKSNKKALKENLEKEEWYIVDINGEVVTEFYDTQEEAEKDCERMNADKDYADNSPYTVESRILDEQFKVKDKKKKKKKIDDNLNKEVGKMKKLTEDAYKVYNTIENRECGTFNSWNDVQNFLNQEWGSYSADKAKENPNFGSEEDKANFFGNYSMDLVQLPVAIEEPATNYDICACEPETCDGCADIEVPADAEVVEIPVEVSTEVAAEEPIENDLDAFIALIVDDEEPVELTCPDCNQEPCVCEQPAEVPAKEIEASVEEPIEEPACEVCGCNPCRCVNETKEETEEKNEEFKDNMGMLTDIQDTDFPDALKSAVDTKEDGTLYKIGDIAKEIEELKASFKTEIENIKAEIKTALSDIKQDIKDDVKDIQIDVTSKLDNTNSKIADLTSEEGLEDEDLDLENEEPAEEENLEEEPVENEEDENGLTESDKKVMVQQYINQNGAIYENIKNVIRTSPLEGKKMSITTVAEKLREEYGINTRVGAVYENVALICEYSPVSKYIIDEDLEKSLLTTQKRGIANKFIKTGLQDMWANQKKEENFSNLKSVLTAQSENLDQAKKAIDKLANQDGNAEKMKKAIELTTDNDQEKEQALDYAVDKIDESYAGDVMSKLLSARGALGGIASVQGIGVNKK